MGIKSEEMWKRIQDFDIDGGAAKFSFRDRLARENGWSGAYADRVIAEYRRFVFLAMTAGHPVTPSDEVDQAWHLHLTYTESYWSRLCGEVLGQPLHHGPTRGGNAEHAKFSDWYARTLASYEQAFGEAPPSDCWPEPHERMRVTQQFRRVNAAENWIIPKRQVGRQGRVWAGATILALTLAGCVGVFRSEYMEPRDWIIVSALLGVFAAFVVWNVVQFFRSVRLRQPTRQGTVDSAAGGASGVAGGCGGVHYKSGKGGGKDLPDTTGTGDPGVGGGDGGGSGGGGGCGGGCGS